MSNAGRILEKYRPKQSCFNGSSFFASIPISAEARCWLFLCSQTILYVVCSVEEMREA